MLMGIRSYSYYGTSTLLINEDKASKIDTKFGYTSWHPSGKLAAYSINHLPMVYHTKRSETRNTVDFNSLIAYYHIGSTEVKTSPEFSKKDMLETWPAWSPDGKYLYFCTSKMLWSQDDPLPPDRFREVKYDLLRIAYNLENDEWGKLETIISAKETGLSIAMPHISPDGRWLLFCMIDYGYFPPWQQESDLYLVDLHAAEKTGRYNYQRLDLNSDESEAWQSFSSNSRWIAFSSKRDYGIFTKTYFSYIDNEGIASKPLLLPQKDPEFYEYCLETYTVPELVTGPVKITGEKLGRIVRSSRKIEVKSPITMATPKAKKSSEYETFQQNNE